MPRFTLLEEQRKPTMLRRYARPNQISKNRLNHIAFSPESSETFRRLYGLARNARAPSETYVRLVEAFKVLNPLNDITFTHLDTLEGLRPATPRQIDVWLELKPTPKVANLKDPFGNAYAAHVYAFMSLFVSLDDAALDYLDTCVPSFGSDLADHRHLRCAVYVDNLGRVDYLKDSIKLWRKHFDDSALTDDDRNWRFHLSHVLTNFEAFRNHLVDVMTRLKSGTVLTIEHLNSGALQRPIVRGLPERHPQANLFKFVTGVACCGKTTLLRELNNRYNWITYSRGEIGSFSGKSKSGACIGNMNAAMDYQLRRSNVIGDRGTIDNVIWEHIMNAISSHVYDESPDKIVHDLIEFVSCNFNALSIEAFAAQRGVIFLDGDCAQNRERMVKRGESGDSYRGRLAMYVELQFIAYYAMALLCNWKIEMVPYDPMTGRFDPAQYADIASGIDQYMREMALPDPDTLVFDKKLYERPAFLLAPIRDCYAEMVGIRR